MIRAEGKNFIIDIDYDYKVAHIAHKEDFWKSMIISINEKKDLYTLLKTVIEGNDAHPKCAFCEEEADCHDGNGNKICSDCKVGGTDV